ncbi:MAG: YceI family protein [Bacteroidota bacterium]|nr:YceI family protein [Bacteroidota bacterium]
MKKFSGILAILALFAISACNSGPKGKKSETGDAMKSASSNADATTYTLITDESVMKWQGAKPTGEHNGTVDFARGFLKVADGELVGGTIMVNMKSIDNVDLRDSPEYHTKLVNHLKSKDFFDVNSYPEALFEIIRVEEIENPETVDGITPTHKITGNLTIKGISKSIAFDAMIESGSEELYAVTPQFVIDRTQWDVNYKSKKIFDNLKDQFINDEVGIIIELNAKERS